MRHIRTGAAGSSPWLALSGAAAVLLAVTNAPAPAAPPGDILRGGVPMGAPGRRGGRTEAAGAAAASDAAARGADVLARNARAIQSVQTLQKAARELARRGVSAVPNGLGVGGLQVHPDVPVDLASPQAGERPELWRGADLPRQTTAAGRVRVAVLQKQPQAMLTWRTFNVGKDTTVRFEQRGGEQRDGSNNWIAFNKILDPTGQPSKILGSLEGEGAVYLINRNGILFGGGSEVNLHSLVASTLPINTNLISRGLLNNPDAQFLLTDLDLASGPNGTPEFKVDPAEKFTPRPGDVVVEEGAVLRSPTTPSKVGGRIMLAGANVENRGTISTPDGQTVLAAGLQVGVAAHSSGDPTLRGLDVYVGAVKLSPADPVADGRVVNTGLLESPRGSVTVTGRDIRQNGVLASTTSVALNGRVDLLASYDALSNPSSSANAVSGQTIAPFLPRATGSVQLGADSVTQVVPELDSTETVVGTRLALDSQIHLEGLAIHADRNASLLATGGDIQLRAGEWIFSAGQTPPYRFVHSAGQIYLDAGAEINAAGTAGIRVPVTQNVVSVELRGAELADSPLQRNGMLRGQTLSVDVRRSGVYNGNIWIGTPLANAAGYAGLIQRTVGELTINGGTVRLSAGESVVLRSGARIDVSGGAVEYTGARVQTTRLVQGSRVIDISQATPDQIYDGIYTGVSTISRPRYGILERYQSALALDGKRFEEGYVYGGAGGALTIVAPAVALDGELRGGTVAGPRQQTVPPSPGTLALSFLKQDPVGPRFQPFSPTPPRLVFQGGVSVAEPADFALDGSGAPAALAPERKSAVYLDPGIFGGKGFGVLRIVNGEGDIVLPGGVRLAGDSGGELHLEAANVRISGQIELAGGVVEMSALAVSPRLLADLVADPDSAATPGPGAGRGTIQVGSEALISTAGRLVDDRLGEASLRGDPVVLDGGRITLSGYRTLLEAGARLDVSGGAVAEAGGAVRYGAGGRLEVLAGQAAPVFKEPILAGVVGGDLRLAAGLAGFSGTRGGTLSILAPRIRVGGPQEAGVLVLAPDFFSQGGFAGFELAGLGGKAPGTGAFLPAVEVSAGTRVAPRVLGARLQADAGVLHLVPVDKPAGVRAAASLKLDAVGVRDNFTRLPVFLGDLVVGAGARIETDPLGAITLHGETVTVLGAVAAPGGRITISGGTDSNTVYLERAQAEKRVFSTVAIGPDAEISVAGTVLPGLDARGYRVGRVLDGGVLHISGNIVAASGALLDASGASGVFDYVAQAGFEDQGTAMSGTFLGARFVPLRVDSNGGLIHLGGGQQLLVDSTLRARAGGSTAMGGQLEISSGRYLPIGDSTPFTPLVRTLTVRQSGGILPESFDGAGTRVGITVVDGGGIPLSEGRISVDRFAAGGFGAVTLSGTIQFVGDVDLSAGGHLSVGSGGVLYGTGAVRLAAPHVSLGTAFRTPFAPEEIRNPFLQGTTPFTFAPVHGTGSLTVNAGLIDIGNLSLQGFGSLTLSAPDGDVRGNGTLNVAGAIRIRAGQIYPPTAATFTMTATDFTGGRGSVTIEAGGARALPLSVGGTLNVFASSIRQSGTLRAPLGSIRLGWDGSGTAPLDLITGAAVPLTEELVLGAGGVTSISAVDPASLEPVVLPYGLSLNGTSWIDPTGLDITAAGPPAKGILLAAREIRNEQGSLVDIRGGADLFAYRWVPGNGGSRDILLEPGRFAILPGYGLPYAPHAPYTTESQSGNLGTDPGYVGAGFKVGDRIRLGGGPGLEAGMYTLLPARYALLPGAFLLSPVDGLTGPDGRTPEGAIRMPGVRLGLGQTGGGLASSFELAPHTVVRQRANYEVRLGNTEFAAGASRFEVAVPRLPVDAGLLTFSASQALSLKGSVLAGAPQGARGGQVDVSSSLNIRIVGDGGAAAPGELSLNARDLSRFGAQSLLVGGTRLAAASTASAVSNRVTVDNAGTPLQMPELILLARQQVELAPGAAILQTGAVTGSPQVLQIGAQDVPGSGNGVALLVSGSPGALIRRTGGDGTPGPGLVVGAGAVLRGSSIQLDSSADMALASSAVLDGSRLTLSAGQVALQLDGSVPVPAGSGLVLGGALLEGLGGAETLSLQSYSSIDLYGAGTFAVRNRLELHSAQIRGVSTGATGVARLRASTLLVDNAGSGSPAGADLAAGGVLVLESDRLEIGNGAVQIDQFAATRLEASGQVLLVGNGGLETAGSLLVRTPVLTAQSAARHTLSADANLMLEGTGVPGGDGAGFGASLNLEGAAVSVGNTVRLAAGTVNLIARTGGLDVTGTLDVGGLPMAFRDALQHADGGTVQLRAEKGSISLGPQSQIVVAASATGGDAGRLVVSAPTGTFTAAGTLLGQASAGQVGGSFELDAGTVDGLTDLQTRLQTGGFSAQRSFRARTGDLTLDGLSKASVLRFTADSGSITVNGTLDASGQTGGEILVSARGSVILENTARLTVAAQEFSAAGKGGQISLQAGATRNGFANFSATLDIRSGSELDLSVAAQEAGSAGRGNFSGILHLRAPQNAGGTDLLLAPIGGQVAGASSILLEGYKTYSASAGEITTEIREAIRANGHAFGARTTAVLNRVLAGNPGLGTATLLLPGAELFNRTGGLTLGTATSNASADWDLSTFRFGPSQVPGFLTVRAKGDLVFLNSLSDGFASGRNTAGLLAPNPLLPANVQSWGLRLTAGADLNAADTGAIVAGATGSLKLGKNLGTNIVLDGRTSTALGPQGEGFQVIRTGSGDIDIRAAGDVQLLNHFATIYTAGTRVAAPTTVVNPGDFDLPVLRIDGSQGELGDIQQTPFYQPQYALGGGSVRIAAAGSIVHLTRNPQDELVQDSQRQMPGNWLYRRGFVDPVTGQFGNTKWGDAASTTWWVDYSNFFQGVGALGGGDVLLVAGRNVENVDAVVPTNARMPRGVPDASSLLELGGGNLLVRAAGSVDGGVYYVERGSGVIRAGESIRTNSTRSPSLTFQNKVEAPESWLPTTLFVGKARFTVRADGDVLLGPSANPFLLPVGVNNTFWLKTYFQTYGAGSGVDVASTGGNVTIRTRGMLESDSASTPLLRAWFEKQLLYKPAVTSSSTFQPWLRLAESSVEPFTQMFALLPPSFTAAAYAGDIRIAGGLTLFPAARGQLEILARNSVQGLNPVGVSTGLLLGQTVRGWEPARLILSDADPLAVPGSTTPFAYQGISGTVASLSQQVQARFLAVVDGLFAETGSTLGSASVLQTKLALHAPGPLHAGDPLPLRIYAGEGDLSGITLFAPKPARILAGRDLTDVGLYLQNLVAADVSVVAAGRDLVAYQPNSPLRIAAQAPGNALAFGSGPLSGDIQISGPGSLEVVAGRNLDLGIGPANVDGTGLGITSIGNARNPALPTEGASLFAGAGLGPSSGLGASSLDPDGFTASLPPAQLAAHLEELRQRNNGSGPRTAAELAALPDTNRSQMALEIFYLALRDAGREFATKGNYDPGFAAIETLFGQVAPGAGDISLTSRTIKTRSGGGISLFAPGGALNVGLEIAGTQALDQGILTEAGGGISIFTRGSINVGTSRIFTLRGGDEILWSSEGDIAAGASSKTVQSAPPTRVIVDAQTADVKTDLAGLATGGGIGVLATVANVAPGNVSLIAPAGTVDAGDAGVRASGNITVAARTVLNAANISAGGASAGVPSAAPSVAPPSLGGLGAAASTTSAASSAAGEAARQARTQPQEAEPMQSNITVEVSFGESGEAGGSDEEKRKRKPAGE